MKTQKYTSTKFLISFAYTWSLLRMLITGLFLIFSGIPAVGLLTFFSPMIIALYQHLWVVSGAVSLYLLIKWFESDRTYFGTKTWHDALVFWVVIVTGINQGLHAFDAHYNVIIYEFIFGDYFFIALGAAYFYFAFHWWQRKNETKIMGIQSPQTF